MTNKILYLGPEGSYSNIVMKKFLTHYSLNNYVIEPIESIYMLIKKLCVDIEKNYIAIMPIENSIEGIVRDTQDNLVKLSNYGYKIFAETSLNIEHSLIGFGQKNEIKKISSHPQALAQCREYIYNTWENSVTLIPVLSTSNAVRNLSKDDTSSAAIASEYCANLYSIPIIEKHINDEKNNTTRFIMLSKDKPLKKELNKISLKFSTENQPGALNRVLNIFESYKLNLSYIDSRPSRKALGEYIFYIDFIGHVEDSNILSALTDIQPYVKSFDIISEGAEVI